MTCRSHLASNDAARARKSVRQIVVGPGNARAGHVRPMELHSDVFTCWNSRTKLQGLKRENPAILVTG